MSSVKKRSSRDLLRAAKRMISDSEEVPQIIRSRSRDLEIRISRYKRDRQTPDYVNLSPKEFMAWWITSTGAKLKASNILLHYIKHKFDVDICTDYRTLLKTPKNPVPKIITPGSYIHVGVRQSLYRLILEAGTIDPANLTANILMQFFVDGLSIAKSTTDGFWVIMINIRHELIKRLTPKVIGVYYGKKKMDNFNEFLWAFVMELNDILEKGIDLDGFVVIPKILNFVLDAPARSGCKAVKGVNGYFGCDVCITEGDNINNRIAFLDLDAPLRNDKDYRERKYDDYHHMESVLEMLPIDMIDSFPHDYLHCALLGVEYWILKYLRDTAKTLSSRDHIEIKNRIEKFQKTEPVEFQHTLRSFIECLGTMKGTEFRQYLLFVGPLLLKDIVSDEIFSNLLKFHIASTIFTHKRFANYYNEADTLMRMFIREFAAIYHPCHVVFVVHSLCHMKKFVDLYGPWDNFSTFEFESQNRSVKDLVRGNVKPLTQITNRILEIYNAPQHKINNKTRDIEISDQQENKCYAKLKFYDLHFRINQVGQNLILLKSGQAVKLVNIRRNATGILLTGSPFKYRTSVYDELDSTRFNIFKSTQEFSDPINFDVMDIDGKFWELDMNHSNLKAYYPIYVEDGKSFSRS